MATSKGKRKSGRAPRKSAIQLYQQTNALYHSLIRVETEALMLSEEVHRTQEDLTRNPLPNDLVYIIPPDPSEPEDLRALSEQRRQEIIGDRVVKVAKSSRRHKGKGPQPTLPAEFTVRSPFASWYDMLDPYHRLEQRLRRALDIARHAAVAAAPELDSTSTPPLARDTTKMRECIQNLGGQVPSPRVVGWMPPGEEVAVAVRQAVAPISDWINKLRAFVYPVAPTHPHSGTKRSRSQPPEVPQARHHSILKAMIELGALDRVHITKAARIAKRAFGDSDSNNAKAPLADMSRWKLTQSLKGPTGGSWLTELGLEYARRAGITTSTSS